MSLRIGFRNKTDIRSFPQNHEGLNTTCIMQVIFDSVRAVKGRARSKQRSGCPVSISLEALGDRWSLLIIRDMMVRAFRTFKQFQESDEKIATNILADRLHKLAAAGIITAEPEKSDGRKVNYRLTEKGIDLAPVVLDLLIWGTRHEETGAPNAVVEKMAANRDQVLAEVRRRWHERDPVPFLPSFAAHAGGRRRKQPGPARVHL